MKIQVMNVGIYKALVAQLDKLYRHNRQGSFRTKERYYEAVKRFCVFLADAFHLQKLEKISAKHLVAYVVYLQDQGKSASTVKTDLAAIRFFHDKMSRPKYSLPSNNELGVELERRRFGGVDRGWSHREFGRFVLLCQEMKREDYAAIACLSYYAGLRIHECFRLDTAAAGAALRTGALTVKGKGGKIRSVPINETVRIELKTMLEFTPRGHKLFVPDDVPTHIAINCFQQYIGAVRPLVQDEDSARPMTHHGLRHSFAARTYRELLRQGTFPLEARRQVSRLLGHERPNVTNIYLASPTCKETSHA
jgi:integrase/recombinase XerD